jgi:outer membrane protein OmpA-like peptidoglycan-associated protein
MSVIEMGAQPSRRHGRLQAVGAAVPVWAALAGLGLLSGCASMNPVNWFHSAEGGVIAQPHQAPPGQNQPYPNLATVPPTPPTPDMAALQHITDALVADRTNAQHLAAAAPLADPSSPTASPDLFGIGSVPPPPPPGAPSASASLPAATAAPAPAAVAAAPPAPAAAQQKLTAPATPPQKAPVGTVQSAPLPDIATATQAPLGNVGPQPAIPAAPPPPPALAGVATPPAVPPPAAATAKVNATAAVPPPAATPQPAPTPATSVLIEFAPDSSSVPAASLPALKALAAKRGAHVIEALGRGDASSSDPAAQQHAVTLGFARAQAIAAALAASGVPRGAIQVMALAAGSGGVAQLVE